MSLNLLQSIKELVIICSTPSFDPFSLRYSAIASLFPGWVMSILYLLNLSYSIVPTYSPSKFTSSRCSGFSIPCCRNINLFSKDDNMSLIFSQPTIFSYISGSGSSYIDFSSSALSSIMISLVSSFSVTIG